MPTDPKSGAPLPPPDEEARPAEPYQPPAVAWEEPFETMAATSCAGTNPFDQNCQVRPAV
jgi:hypothetical protein